VQTCDGHRFISSDRLHPSSAPGRRKNVSFLPGLGLVPKFWVFNPRSQRINVGLPDERKTNDSGPAVKAGILAADDRRRFGFHNLRHSLASYLVTQTKTDVKTVQSMLRHADIGTTLDIYTHAINRDKLVAQNQVMEAMMKLDLVN
jgi:integrase